MPDMATLVDTRLCLSCGKPLRGRIDKKFCDDYCRNNFNNRQKAREHHSSLVRKVNSSLLRNRKILESLLPEGEETSKATRDRLNLLGFQFKYLTHTYTTRNNKTYYYCYDHGYLPLDNDWFLIVRRKESDP